VKFQRRLTLKAQKEKVRLAAELLFDQGVWGNGERKAKVKPERVSSKPFDEVAAE